MATETRKTGIDVIGDMVAWGTHFCVFYETKEDLLDTLISYYKSGLERGEYCLGIVAEPLTIEEATDALKNAVPNLDRYLADSSLEFTSARDWFLQGGTFDGKRVTGGFYEKLARASARGYPSMRVAGEPAENVNKIFDAFFTTKSQGTGLGLAITRSIVKSHGGRIWATENSGRGATFHFTLPSTVAVPA